MEQINKRKGPSAFCGYILLWVTILAGVAVRIWQLFCAVDFQTGFYTEHISVPLLNGILWGGGVLSIAAAVFFRRCDFRQTLTEKKSGFLTLAYVLTAILCGVQAIGYGVSALLTHMQTGSAGLRTFDLLVAVLLLLSVLSFAVLARDNRRGKPSGFVSILPAIYAGMRLMALFMEHTTIANISAYLFEILFYAAATVFVLLIAKDAMQLDAHRSDSFLLLAGMLTALFGMLILLPDYFGILTATVTDSAPVGLAAYLRPPRLDIIGFTLTALVYLGTVLKVRKQTAAQTETE